MTDLNFAASPTGAGLVAFLDFAMQKGYVKVATGQALKTAVKEVLSATEGEGWESVDLSGLDVHDVLRRFETLRAMKYSSGSLATYKGRFQRSLSMFSEFRESPAAWRPTVKQRTRSTPTSDKAVGTPAPVGKARPDRHASPASSSSESSTTHRATIITYPFPIRDGVLASIELPADLTGREARRLAAFIESVAIDESPDDLPRPPETEGGSGPR